MTLRRTFIVRLFCVLFVSLLAILITAGAGIYTFARQVAGQEFIRLNQASLWQLAAATGRSLSEIRSFGERVAVNSTLLSIPDLRGEEGRKAAQSILNDLLNEYKTIHTYNRSMMNLYVMDRDGSYISAYNADGTILEGVRSDPRCTPLFLGEADMVLLPTRYNSEGQGVTTYSFQMVFAMRDLLTGYPRGVVVLELSELTLYQQYRSFQKGDVRLAVISPEGAILSSQEKRAIGEPYGYDAEALAELTGRSQVNRRIVDGKFHLSERIPGTDWLLVEQLPAAAAFEPLTLVKNRIFTMIAISGVLALWVLTLTARSILRRVVKIKDKMEQVIGGDLSVQVSVERGDEFGRIETAFNTMVAEIAQLIETVRQGEQQKRRAELDFLQAQINPHFIHNTLTSIRFMLEMDKSAEAGEMIFYFSKLLRQTLSRSGEFIALGEEVETLESYISLQKFRYKDVFEVDFHIPEETLEARVPTLILQPVVENAIFHSVGYERVHIGIRARREGERLILVVEDNGVGMPRALRESVLHKDVQINRVGLRNVHDRIQLNYGREYGLAVTGREGQGTTITFTLPFDEGHTAREGDQA